MSICFCDDFSVVFDTFYSSSLNVFLVAIDCGYIGVPVPYINQFEPNVICFASPHIFVYVAAILSSALFTAISFCIVLKDFEWSSKKAPILAKPLSQVEATIFICKTSMSFVAIFFQK